MDKKEETNKERILSEAENKLPAELEELLKDIPIEKRERVRRTLIISRSFAGPLPPPELLAEYNRLIPNGADRIMKMAENQNQHRIRTESKLVDEGLNHSKLGQILGFLLGVVGIGSATILGVKGHDWLAAIIGGSTVISLVSAFIIGKSKAENIKPNNLEESD